MNPEEAVQTLREAGLFAQHTPEKAFCDIMVCGDPQNSFEKVECFQWVCWIVRQDTGWQVCLPPHPAPGPGPEFIVSTLEEAVSLTGFAFARRLPAEGLSAREEFEHAHCTYDEWIQERGK